MIYAVPGTGYKAAGMFSLQKLFAKDDKFFELLAASAEESRASVQVLKQVLEKGKTDLSLDDFAASRRKEKQITAQISELLARTTVTVLDREDVEAISSVLYKIPKTVEKFAERYLISAPQLKGVDFTRQVVLLEKATDTVAAMIKELEKSHFEQVNQHNENLQRAEGEADDLMIQLLKELYSGKYPPLTVTIVKDLYELLEKVVDRCRDVGNVVANVVLKHS
jgi:uncharacterized protein Yka (UPF0111/DUF47 family)